MWSLLVPLTICSAICGSKYAKRAKTIA
jgi:hypothetical protein